MTKQAGKSALLIIDVQNEYLKPPETASIPIFDVQGAVVKIMTVLDEARKAGIPIIHFQEIHRKEKVDFGRELDGEEGVHCIEGTHDAEIIDELKPLDGEYVIKKRRYSGFFATDLDLLLRGLGVETVIVAGFLTDICVQFTCADAHQYDYYVKVMHDCVRGSSVAAHDAALKTITYLQKDSKTDSNEIINLLKVESLVR